MEEYRMKNKNGLKGIIITFAIILTIQGVLPWSSVNALQTVTYAAAGTEYYVVETSTETGITTTTAETATTEEPASTVEPEAPSYTVEAMSATLYAQQAANVRSGPSTDYEVIGSLSLNKEVVVTGKASTGWYRISYNGGEGFVANSLLGSEKVVVQTPAPSTTPAASETPTPTNDGPKERWEYTEAELIQICLSECITPGMTDFEKATAINNYLINLMSYDYSYKHVSTFDALAYGTGVCQGYANAYKKLMDAAGIPTDYVSGQANGGRHAWNRSLIGGQYYYTDVCWNDSMGGNYYLLISYEEISVDHEQWEINRQNRVK